MKSLWNLSLKKFQLPSFLTFFHFLSSSSNHLSSPTTYKSTPTTHFTQHPTISTHHCKSHYSPLITHHSSNFFLSYLSFFLCSPWYQIPPRLINFFTTFLCVSSQLVSTQLVSRYHSNIFTLIPSCPFFCCPPPYIPHLSQSIHLLSRHTLPLNNKALYTVYQRFLYDLEPANTNSWNRPTTSTVPPSDEPTKWPIESGTRV